MKTYIGLRNGLPLTRKVALERYALLSVAAPPVIAAVRNAICERVVKHPKEVGRQSLRYYAGQ